MELIRIVGSIPNRRTAGVYSFKLSGAVRLNRTGPVAIEYLGSRVVRCGHALGSVIFVLTAVSVEITPDFGRTEEEYLVDRNCRRARFAATLVVGQLFNGLNSTANFRRQQRIEITRIQ